MHDPAANVMLLCLDADGVMTDGSIRIYDHGAETKRFHVRDGTAMRIWMKLGFELAIITGRSGLALRHRADELGVRYLYQGVKNKGECFLRLTEKLGLESDQAAMLADDLPDLPLLRLCGYPMAVADAVPEVRSLAAFVTTRPGGSGAVRESIEHLLNARGRWNDAVGLYDLE